MGIQVHIEMFSVLRVFPFLCSFRKSSFPELLGPKYGINKISECGKGGGVYEFAGHINIKKTCCVDSNHICAKQSFG